MNSDALTLPNCSLTPTFYQMAQKSYLPYGKVYFEPSRYEPQVYKLGDPLRLRTVLNGENKEAKYHAFYETARDYLKLADKEDHPADLAVALHRAGVMLGMANFLFPGRIQEDRLEQIVLGEAQACSDAAKSAEDPTEKLSWIFRGIKELGLHQEYASFIPGIFCSSSQSKGKCYAAASLWEDAGKIFSTCPSVVVAAIIPVLRPKPFITYTNEEAAAFCYYKAGYFMEVPRFTSLDGPSMSSELYRQAYAHYKKLDFSKYSLEQQALLQEEIVRLCFRIWAISESLSYQEVFQEVMTAQRIYEEAANQSVLKRTLFSIMQAWHLEKAGLFAPTLEDSLNLYKRAQDILEREWDTHREECQRSKVFRHPTAHRGQPTPSSWDLKDSLLGRLRRKVKQTEHKLAQTSDSSLFDLLKSFFTKK